MTQQPDGPAPDGPVPGVPGPVPERPPRRTPSTLGGLVYLVVLGLSVVGLAVIAFGPWRRGVTIIGVGMLLAAVARLLLSDFNGGMLRVRSKWFDVGALVGLGVVLVLLAAVIPNQPPV